MKRFRLYPDCHWVYFEVIVHRSAKELRRYTKEEERCVGLCKGWLRGHVPSGKIKAKIGEIHLCRSFLGIGVASHEICHAVHRYFWVRRTLGLNNRLTERHITGGKYAGNAEESFCWVLGEMVRQFCVIWWRKEKNPQEDCKHLVLRPIKPTIRAKCFQ